MPGIDDAAIGDFSRSVVPKPAQGSPEKDRLDQTEARLGQEATSIEKATKPLESYEEQLKEVGVSREEAAQIIDAILMQGYYAEDIHLTKRIVVRLRTRLYRDTRRTQDYIERAMPKYDNHYNEIVNRYALAASIEQLGPTKLEHPKTNASADEIEKSFENRLTFVESLIEPTLRLLFNKLYRFDLKLRVVLEEGALENF